MWLFNKNKAENQELTPEQKAGKLLDAVKTYIQENKDVLENNEDKTKRLRDITSKLEETEITEEEVQTLAEQLQAEGIEVNLDAEANDEELESKSSRKKTAGFILAALLALWVVGWGAYMYSNSWDKSEKEKTKTEQEGRKEVTISDEDASHKDNVEQLEAVIKQAKEEWEKLDKLMK